MNAGKHRRRQWWPWSRHHDHSGVDDARKAIETSLRDLGHVEDRTPQVDALAARARNVTDALATERQINHFNQRIRDALGGKTA